MATATLARRWSTLWREVHAPALRADASLHDFARAAGGRILPGNELHAAIAFLRPMRLVLVLRHRLGFRAALRRRLRVQHQSAEGRSAGDHRALTKQTPPGGIECIAGHLGISIGGVRDPANVVPTTSLTPR